MESKITTKNECSFTKLISDHGKAEFVRNKAGHMCIIFPDGFKAFVSKKADEQMMGGDRDKSNYQFAEVQCADGTWCPTVMPRYTANILFSIE